MCKLLFGITVFCLVFKNEADIFKTLSEWNKYGKSIATKLFYQQTPIDSNTAIFEKFVCY